MAISLSREKLIFDYSKLPSEYHASSSPEDTLVLYKGAFKGLEKMGMNSLALKKGRLDSVALGKRIFEEGEEYERWRILNAHADYYIDSPFLSATFNPEMAQTFATCDAKHPDYGKKTIYQLTVKANRCFLDYQDVGGCGSSKELMVLGVIFPEEITGVKNLNDNNHSELSTGGIFPEKDSTNIQVKDSSNWTWF